MLLTHGSDDPVVPYAASEEIERRLRQAGLSSDSQRLRRLRFQGGHGIDPGLFPVMRQVLEEGWAKQPEA